MFSTIVVAGSRPFFGGSGLDTILGVTSPFFPGILLLENHQTPRGNGRLLKRTTADKNGKGVNPYSNYPESPNKNMLLQEIHLFCWSKLDTMSPNIASPRPPPRRWRLPAPARRRSLSRRAGPAGPLEHLKVAFPFLAPWKKRKDRFPLEPGGERFERANDHLPPLHPLLFAM